MRGNRGRAAERSHLNRAWWQRRATSIRQMADANGAASPSLRAAQALTRLGAPLPAAAGHDDVLEALDVAIAELEGQLIDRSSDPAVRERWGQLTELLDLRTTIGEDHLRQRLMVFGRVQEALARLRDVRSTEAMIRRAP